MPTNQFSEFDEFQISLEEQIQDLVDSLIKCECHQSAGKNLEIPHSSWCPRFEVDKDK